MAQHWTSRVSYRAREMGRVFRNRPRDRSGFGSDSDPDARRMRVELDAIRARFPDHA